MSYDTSGFPVEVLTLICKDFSRDNLRAVRFVSHNFNRAASEVLFHTIFLKVNPQSFGKLLNISRHVNLRKHVRMIQYDGSVLYSTLARRDMRSWLQHGAATGFGFDKVNNLERQHFLNQFTPRQLEVYYHKYCYWSLWQISLYKDDRELIFLIQAMMNFPGLSSIGYFVTEHRYDRYSPLRGPLHLTPLGSAAREILAEPGRSWDPSESDKHFWTFLYAAYLSSDHGKRLKSISCFDTDRTRWLMIAKSFPWFIELLPKLEHLSLSFKASGDSEIDTICLSKILAGMPLLQSLSLNFNFHSVANPEYNIDLEMLISSEWKNLRSLSLRAILTTQRFLQNMLLAHAQNLRSLSLSYIILELDDLSSPSKGCWPEIIHFLGESMALTEIKFHGDFSNRMDERWTTNGYREYKGEKWLRYRIERFITHGAQCPFELATDSDIWTDAFKRIGYRDWVFEDDESWQLKSSLSLVQGNIVLY